MSYLIAHSSDCCPQAINSFLAGLPLVLHDGYISSITARVPWPNPLTSNLGLSLDALHLTFHVVPNVTTPLQGPDLVESVASAAETFMQEELVEQEDATLLDSVHSEASRDMGGVIPGGLDPFMSHDEEVAQTKDDSAGVPLFASLLEKLLARFEFKAINTEITLVHPGNTSLTLSIAEIRYGREANVGASQNPIEGDHPTLTVSGVRITTRDLGPCLNPSPAGSYTGRSSSIDGSSYPQAPSADRPDSPAESSSSLDEETREFMSRSFVSLPPRSDSFIGSASSSLYESAFSEENSQRHLLSLSKELESQDHGLVSNQNYGSQSGSGQGDTSGDVLLSLGSVPLVIRIQAPSSNDHDADPAARNSFGVNISMGAVGFACHARQLASIIALAGCFDTQRTAKPSSRANANSVDPITRGPNWNIDVGIEGLVALVLPGGLAPESRASLSSFFARPLTLPHLSNGYACLRISGIHAEIALSKVFPNSSPQGGKTDRTTSATLNLNFGLRCADINASVHSLQTPESKMVVYPILFTDQRLRSQYIPPRVGPKGDGRHVHLPTLMVNSHWATELQDHGSNLPEALLSDDASDNTLENDDESPRTRRTSASSNESAIAMNIERITAMEHGKQPRLLKDEASISILPLHILLDIEQLSNRHVAEFLQELVAGVRKETTSNQSNGNGGKTAVDNDQKHDPSATTLPISEREKELKHPERLILKDTDLQPDLGESGHKRMGMKVCHEISSLTVPQWTQ